MFVGVKVGKAFLKSQKKKKPFLFLEDANLTIFFN